MPIIRRIDLNFIKKFVDDTIKLISQIKLFQEELEDVTIQINENEKYFSEGKISKDVFEANKKMLEKERLEVSLKIEKLAERISKIIKRAKSKIEENKI